MVLPFFFPLSPSNPRPLVAGFSFLGRISGIGGVGGAAPCQLLFESIFLRDSQPVYNSSSAAVCPPLPSSFADTGIIVSRMVWKPSLSRHSRNV